MRCSSGYVAEWQKALEALLKSSKSARGWFICNILFQSKTIVRYFFTNVFALLLNATRNDLISDLQPFIDECPEFNFDALQAMGDTVSDMLISLLLIIPRSHFHEFCSHPTQYIVLFSLYAQSGLEQRKQLVRKGALTALMMLISVEDYRLKVIYQDNSKLYEVISLLLRSCRFEWQTEEMGTNPYAITDTDLILAPANVIDWTNEPVLVKRFLKQLVDLPSDHGVAVDTMLFLSWENLHFTKILLHHFSLE
ncbi:unnamed protein product, partial [Gongylonema pulchrum]|uniref:DUF3517 domain-containing protein n=1 Tax=Gongylonema pulchrum TaxID=637853 RepID=A0A183D3E7_9BILA